MAEVTPAQIKQIVYWSIDAIEPAQVAALQPETGRINTSTAC